MNRSLLSVGFLLLALTGCDTSLNIGDQRFSCQSDQDCLAGYVCRDLGSGPECVDLAVFRDISVPDGHMDTGPDEDVMEPPTCLEECPGDLLCCGEDCVDPKRSALHCGSCINACASGEVCVDGSCEPDTCADFRIVSATPPPGAWIPSVYPFRDQEVTWIIELSCPLADELTGDQLRVRGLWRDYAPDIAVDDNLLTVKAVDLLAGDRLSLELTGIESEQYDKLPGIALGDYLVQAGWANGRFSVAKPIVSATDVRDAHAVDVNQDQQPDLLVLTGESLLIFMASPDGSLPDEPTHTSELTAASVVAGDIDGDNDVDLLAFVAAGKPVLLRNQRGPDTLSFVSESLSQIPADAVAGDLADIDFDGDQDLAVVFSNAADGRIGAVWLNHGNGVGELRPIVDQGLSAPEEVEMYSVAIGPLGEERSHGVVFGGVRKGGGTHLFVWDGERLERVVKSAMAVDLELALLGLEMPSLFAALGFDLPAALIPIEQLNFPTCPVGFAPPRLSQPSDLRGRGVLETVGLMGPDRLEIAGFNEAGCAVTTQSSTITPLQPARPLIPVDWNGDGFMDLLSVEDDGIALLAGNDRTGLLDFQQQGLHSSGVLPSDAPALFFNFDRPIMSFEPNPLWAFDQPVWIRGEQSGLHIFPFEAQGDGYQQGLDPAFIPAGAQFVAGERVHVTVKARDSLRNEPFFYTWVWYAGGQPAASPEAMTRILRYPGGNPPPGLSSAPLVGLLNDDENPDLAVATLGGVTTWLNDGTAIAGSLLGEVFGLDGSNRQRQRVVAADFYSPNAGEGADGDLDWVMPGLPLENDGSGRFSGDFFDGFLVTLDAGDIAGDGMLDLINENEWTGQANPGGFFGGQFLIDLDRDGRLDVGKLYGKLVDGEQVRKLAIFSHRFLMMAPCQSSDCLEASPHLLQTVSTEILLDDPRFTAFQVGDFDGDRDEDLMVVGFGSTDAIIEFFENADGVLTRRSSFPIPPPGDRFGITAADFDGDLELELALAVQDPMSGDEEVRFYELDGQMPPGISHYGTLSTDLSQITQLVPTDWNRDGVVDLVVGTDFGGAVWIGNPE